MLTICPSPFCPLTIAVTSTRVSLATKFRIHRSYLLEWPVCAWRSNLRAEEKGIAARRRRVLAAGPMRTILATTVKGRMTEQTVKTTIWTATDCRRVELVLSWRFGFSNRKLTSLLKFAWRAKSASPNSTSSFQVEHGKYGMVVTTRSAQEFVAAAENTMGSSHITKPDWR